MEEIEVGDVVKLLCCPQEVVVSEIVSSEENPEPRILCVWIDDWGKPMERTYRSEVLTVVKRTRQDKQDDINRIVEKERKKESQTELTGDIPF